MEKFLKLRNRSLQTLLLGLVVLTFYTYYRTTKECLVTDSRIVLTERTPPLELPIVSLNSTAETIMALAQSSKNSSLDTSIVKETNFHRITNEATINVVASPSTIVASQTSLISTNLQIIVNNDTLTQRSGKITNETTSLSSLSLSSSSLSPPSSSLVNHTKIITTTVNSNFNNTARAMYRTGHDVSASDKCPNNGTEINLVIVITSAPSHADARIAIRQTWGHYDQRRDVAILFMLGSTGDNELEKTLKKEERLYGDVIRGRYIDSYTNLTLKTISSLEWFSNYCNEAKFMLKTDDDMFINVPRLLSFIDKHMMDKNSIYGRLARKWKPFRKNTSKYYVPTWQYKPAVFPDFTTGPAYLMSRDVVEKLYLTALDQTYLKLEDVFTTGIVAQKLGIKRFQANEFLNKKIAYNPCSIQRAISIHMVKYSEQFDLWKKLLDGRSKCK